MDEEYAKRIFVHYFALLFEKLQLPWNEDNRTEIEGAVESIVAGAKKNG